MSTGQCPVLLLNLRMQDKLLVLRGKDAIDFMKQHNNPKPVSEEERLRVQANYMKLKSIQKFELHILSSQEIEKERNPAYQLLIP